MFCWRFVLSWCIFAVMLSALPSAVLGELANESIFPKREEIQLRSAPGESSQIIANFRTPCLNARRFENGWFFVGVGWARATDVVTIQEAVAYFSADIQKRPSSFAYAARSRAHSLRLRHENALEDAERAIGIGPLDPVGFLARAVALEGLGRLESAIEDYAKAIKFGTTAPEAFTGRAACLIQLGRSKDAVADLDRALQLDPEGQLGNRSRAGKQ